jgi:hypothetical protein
MILTSMRFDTIECSALNFLAVWSVHHGVLDAVHVGRTYRIVIIPVRCVARLLSQVKKGTRLLMLGTSIIDCPLMIIK